MNSDASSGTFEEGQRCMLESVRTIINRQLRSTMRRINAAKENADMSGPDDALTFAAQRKALYLVQQTLENLLYELETGDGE